MPLHKMTQSTVRNFLQQQQALVFAAVAVFAVLSVLKVSTHLWANVVFALCIGNLTFPIMEALGAILFPACLSPELGRGLLILAFVSLGTVMVATGIIYTSFMQHAMRTASNVTADIRLGTLVTFIVGVVYEVYASMKSKLESQNVVLQAAVQTGISQLNSRRRNSKPQERFKPDSFPHRFLSYQI
jgi:predicted PurR-regulated permease PerM